MRQRYLVTYDIADPKRLRQVFRVMKAYGEHLQFSVFLCDLSPMALARMKGSLGIEIHETEDQVLIVDLGPADGRGSLAFESLGRRYEEKAREPKII